MPDLKTPPLEVFDGGRRRVLGGLAAILTLPLLGRSARAADGAAVTLIMVDEPGCQYCRKWDAEIGRGYPRTKEGRFAPLMRVRRKSPQLSGFNPVIYTPTFILARRGQELGRITGYPGAEYFYAELGDLLAKAGYAQGFSDGTKAI